jgi:hypothetical protein
VPPATAFVGAPRSRSTARPTLRNKLQASATSTRPQVVLFVVSTFMGCDRNCGDVIEVDEFSASGPYSGDTADTTTATSGRCLDLCFDRPVSGYGVVIEVLEVTDCDVGPGDRSSPTVTHVECVGRARVRVECK